ncbi:hypothetical protein JWG39_03640 [Desulforhopalus vacuolatus]|uniref:hypothetical protein n=1 Tax=Desulforhopalus vacuolatus TaxID=40414 RepID=UPI001963736B|nr:hypothetical protein [Desulforhopalus vacuolatus]MBM9518906.1 hypothetical protein [Desulforhopalus vacuolatus]
MPIYIDSEADKFIAESKQLETNYKEACDWINSFGVNYKITRFGEYQKDVEYFIKNKNQGSAKESVKTFMNAHLEANELIRIKTTFESFDSSQLVDTIKKMASGKRFRNSSSTDQSRDFAFELNIASRFAKAGFLIDLKGISDVVVIIENRKLFVECKRLKSYKQLEKRVKAANVQISKRLANDLSPKCRGVIALNLTDILNPDAMPIIAPSLKEHQTISAKILRDFVLSEQNALSRKRNKKCLGVFTEFSTEGFINADTVEDAAFVYIREGNIYEYPLNSGDRSFLNSFWPKLGNQHIL